MTAFLGLLAILCVLAVWYWRVKGARGAKGKTLDPAGDARLASRRLMQRRNDAGHPADAVDDPRLAASGIIVAVATMDGPISQREIARLKRAAEETFEVSEREALDILSFGRWIASQCASNAEAVRRLSKIVMKTAGPAAGPDLVRMIQEVATADGGELGEEERDALETVRRTLGIEPAGRRSP
jgi:uncharacterized tellurite resistance protein B-like protein